MSAKGKKFTDDSWALWIEGDDTSTIYFYDWMNPRGKSFIDVSIKIVGIKKTSGLSLYVPFKISREEIEDISLQFKNEEIARATFSSGCIIDYMKNKYTSEIAYNGKTVDIVHLSKLELALDKLSDGTLITVNYGHIQSYIDNEEGYFSFRLPHKSLDRVFSTYKSAGSFLVRLRDLITSPIQSEKYGYSIRVNEARNLPPEINKIGAFHRQKLKKAVVTVSVSENYEINDANCFQIRRLEEGLYRDFVPSGFVCDDVITYQWKESRKEDVLHGKFNFYLNIKREAVSAASMVIYMILLVIMGGFGNFFAELVSWLMSLI
jgi:hypothetical protein